MDYIDVWTRWIAFLQSDVKVRKEVLESLNLEVKQGFTIIAKVSSEELEYIFSKTDFFSKIKPDLYQVLLYGVWCGYLLYLISEEIDPVEENLVGESETNDLGNKWLESYKKDKCASLLVQIDPLLSMILQNTAESEFNQLVNSDSKQVDVSYTNAIKIISFIHWTMHQGFIFGIIEQKLIENKESVGK